MDSWHGHLAVALNQHQTVTGRLDLTRDDKNRHLALALDGVLAEILPPGMRDVFAGSLHVKGTAALAEDFTPLGGRLDMTSDAVSFNANGNFDRSSGRLSTDLEATLLRPAHWSEGNARISANALDLTATASGILSDAQWNTSLTAAGVSTADGRLDTLSLKAGGDNADFGAETLNVPVTLEATADVGALAASKRLPPQS